MTRVTIGKTEDGKPVELLMDRLVHGFVAGSTRSGKSNTMRVILERVRGPILANGGTVHQAIIDPEGEFAASLAQLGDYIVFNRDGPLRIDPETAPALARQFVELGFNVIADMSDVPREDAQEWIAGFCRELAEMKVDASPRAHGRRALVVIDEGQKFAPELNKKEKGVEYPAASAIIELVSTGAKRHVHVLIGSQRMAKVRADIRSECSTLLIGKHNRDDDREEAAKELGLRRAAAKNPVVEQIATLTQGWFLARGDGVSDELVLVHVDKAKTDIPDDLGSIARAPVPTSQATRAILSQLKDFEHKAKEEARTLDAARGEVRRLRERVAELEARDLTAEETRSAELAGKLLAAEERVERAVAAAEDHVNAAWAQWADDLQEKVISAKRNIEAELARLLIKRRPDVHTTGVGDNTPDGPPRMPRQESIYAREAARAETVEVRIEPRPPTSKPAEGVTRPQQDILDGLAELAKLGFKAPSREMLAGWLGITATAGSFGNKIGALRSLGLLQPATNDGTVSLTPAGVKAAAPATTPLTAKDMRARVARVLSGPENELLDILLRHYPKAVSKEQLAKEAGISPGAGSFGNKLGRMRTLCLIDYPERGQVRANDWLLLKGGR